MSAFPPAVSPRTPSLRTAWLAGAARRGAVVLGALCASLAFGALWPAVASGAPAGATPGDTAPLMGTIAGTVNLAPANAAHVQPLFTGACSDLTVVARTRTGTGTTKATGNVTSGACAFSLRTAVGSYSVDLQVDGRSALPPAALAPTADVRAGQTSTLGPFKITWATHPTTVVSGVVDLASNAFATCANTKVVITHPLRTVEQQGLTQIPGNRCTFILSWVLAGAVTVSASSSATIDLPPPQAITLVGGTPANLELAFPKYATIRTRLRPSTYPQQTPGLDCTPYQLVVRKDSTVVATKTFTNQVNMDCMAQTSQQVPTGVPVTWELKKNGAVVQSQTLTLTPLQFFDKIVTPLP